MGSAVVEWDSGRVAERSESSNPMIASGNHTDSNSDRPYRVLRTIRVDRAMCQQNRPLGTRELGHRVKKILLNPFADKIEYKNKHSHSTEGYYH